MGVHLKDKGTENIHDLLKRQNMTSKLGKEGYKTKCSQKKGR